MLRYIFIFIFFLDAGQSQAQSTSDKFVYTSPSGNYILLETDNKNLTATGKSGYTIERSRSGQNNFSRIGDFAPVKNYAELEKIISKPMAQEIKTYLKAKSDQEVVDLLHHPDGLSKFGFYILNVDLLRAAGLVFLDEMPQQTTGQYEYRIVHENRTIRQQAAKGFQPDDLPKGKTSYMKTTDSLIRIGWDFSLYNLKFPLLAQVYYQDNLQGSFKPYHTLSTLNQEEGKMTTQFEERARPETMKRYFVVAVDIFGNEGLPSDTISAITVDFRKIPGIEDLVIKDTTFGLYCEWKPLPAKPYYTGIQILRSTDPMKDFIVLDSISATATSYADHQVLSNTTYYYKFRPLAYKISGWGEIIATTANGTKSSSKTPPLVPKNIAAFHDGRNIRLTWDANTELDIFAYYILRGTSVQNMEIVSSAITDTVWIDTTENLNGRVNYLYSVLAINNSQLKSVPSGAVGIRPDRAQFIEPPSGINIRAEGSALHLSWPDMARRDPTVAGYILYRKKENDKEYKPIQKDLLLQPVYEDVQAEKNIKYHYVVTSVDFTGYESAASPEAEYTIQDIPAPVSVFFVRKSANGVEISWPLSERADVTSYNIYRRLPEDTKYVKAGSVSGKNGSFIDRVFAANKLNVYCITITTTNGESEKSIEKTILMSR